MTTNKRKKVVKYRAHTTHGGGHRKKRRGAGNRGGRGNAGSGKRGKAKKQSCPRLGKHGFIPRNKKSKINSINLGQLNTLLENKKLEVKDNLVDLSALKYHKLLSAGEFTQKIKIKISQFSKKTAEKVQTAGGEIISTTKKEKINSTPKEKSEVEPAHKEQLEE